MRRIAAVLLAVCLLTGCGAGQTASKSEEKKTMITYMVQSYGGESGIQEETLALLKKLYPDIELQIITYSEEQYYAVLRAKLATGKGPDLFDVQPQYSGTNGVSTLAEAGYLASVTDWECIRNRSSEDDSLMKYEGEVYSVSQGRMALGVLYNKTLFSELGLEWPGCWEEFLECCEMLKACGVQPLIQNGKNNSAYQYGLYQIAANRIYPVIPEYDAQVREGMRKFTDKGTWDTVLQMYSSLFSLGYIPEESFQLTEKDVLGRMKSRKAAMIFTESGQVMQSIKELEESGDSYGFCALPANKRGENTYWSMGNYRGIGVYAETEKLEECKEILSAVFWNREHGNYESWSAMQRQQYKEVFQELNQAEKAQNYIPVCNQEWNNEVEVVMEKLVIDYLTGGEVTIEDITSAMQEELDR